MSRYTVVLDSCVLHPNLLRDLLMRLRPMGLFRSHWTHKIHEEWMESVHKKHPKIPLEKLQRIRTLMDAHAEDALIEGFEPLEQSIQLPDPNDRHIVAAAIRCGADAIITFNLKDFPAENLAPYNIEVIHPDDFIIYQIGLSVGKVCQALKAMREALKNPPFSAMELLEALEKNQLPTTAAVLEDFTENI